MFVGVKVPVSTVYHLYSIADAFCYQMWRESHIDQQRHMRMSHIVNAYKRNFSFFSSTTHISTNKAFGKGEHPVVWFETIYFICIGLNLLHNGVWHGDGSNAVLSLRWRYNIAACLAIFRDNKPFKVITPQEHMKQYNAAKCDTAA